MDASKIIDLLGGTTAVAKLCQVKQPSVSEWRRNGIPRARRQFLEVVRPDVFDTSTAATSNRKARKHKTS